MNTHNVRVLDWTLIVTLFGWALVLGGASRIVGPRMVGKVGGGLIGRATITRIVRAFGSSLRALLNIIVEGESLINDGTAVVVFKIILAIAAGATMETSIGGLALDSLREFLKWSSAGLRSARSSDWQLRR